jgi:hypothetical protein
MKYDRRPRIRSAVTRDDRLTKLEIRYLFAVLDAPPEKDENGRQIRGTRTIRPDGTYALHNDHIARLMNRSTYAVQRARRGCQAKGYVSEPIVRGTYGRPDRLQLFVPEPNQATDAGDDVSNLVVRVAETYTPYEKAKNRNPYGSEEPPIRVAENRNPYLYSPAQLDQAESLCRAAGSPTRVDGPACPRCGAPVVAGNECPCETPHPNQARKAR